MMLECQIDTISCGLPVRSFLSSWVGREETWKYERKKKKQSVAEHSYGPLK